MDQGWIKIHRELLGKPIWTEATPKQKVLLITLLMMANHCEKKWQSFRDLKRQVLEFPYYVGEMCGRNVRG